MIIIIIISIFTPDIRICDELMTATKTNLAQIQIPKNQYRLSFRTKFCVTRELLIHEHHITGYIKNVGKV